MKVEMEKWKLKLKITPETQFLFFFFAFDPPATRPLIFPLCFAECTVLTVPPTPPARCLRGPDLHTLHRFTERKNENWKENALHCGGLIIFLTYPTLPYF